MPDTPTRLWWKLDGEECADAVNRTCESLERTQGPRRIRWRRNVELYEGRRLAGLNPAAYFTETDISTDDYDKLRVNLARALVHTVVAKIAGKQKPKAQFVVSDGDWTTKRKAKKMERFVEAHMLARQGQHHDAWSVGLQSFRDCCVGDLGVMKYEANLPEKRVDIRRCFGWELMVHANEARLGQPQNLFHAYSYDRFKLVERFPEHEEDIMTAPNVTNEADATDWQGSGHDAERMVRVREAWRLPLSDEKPGRHAIVVGKTDLTGGEEWTRRFYPFEFFVWEPWMMGMYGTSVVDNVFHLVDELNAAAQRMSDADRLCSNAMIVAERGSVKQEDLESNKIGVVVYYEKGSPAPPQLVPANPIGQSSIQWWQLLESQTYKVPGISQMGATGQKEPGVDAAVAMRTIENIATERFAPQWEHYERVMAIGSARQILACVREMMEDDPDYIAKWPGQGFLQELKASDVLIDDEMYQIQIYSVSGLVNTPADRLQLGADLFNQKVISKESYLRIIQAKDIDSELDQTNEWSQLTEKYIEQWLDATKETEQSGEFLYYPPIKFAPLPDLIVQVGKAYAKAQLHGAPDYNLGFFIRFMGQCDAQIQSIAAQQAQLQAAAHGPPQQLPPGPGGQPTRPSPPPGPGAPMPPTNGAPPPGVH